MNGFCSKLVSSGLDKHASLSPQIQNLTIKPVHYESVMFYIMNL